MEVMVDGAALQTDVANWAVLLVKGTARCLEASMKSKESRRELVVVMQIQLRNKVQTKSGLSRSLVVTTCS